MSKWNKDHISNQYYANSNYHIDFLFPFQESEENIIKEIISEDLVKKIVYLSKILEKSA